MSRQVELRKETARLKALYAETREEIKRLNRSTIVWAATPEMKAARDQAVSALEAHLQMLMDKQKQNAIEGVEAVLFPQESDQDND